MKLCFQLAKSSKSILSSIDLQSLTIADKSTPTTTSTAEALQQSDFFYSRATNDIQPLLRYCKYELGQLSKEEIASICDVELHNYNMDNYDDDDEVMEREKMDGGMDDNYDDDDIATVTFRGKIMSIDEPNLKMALIQITNTKEKLDTLMSSSGKKKKVKASSKESTFMQLLNCYDDATSIVSKYLKDYEGMVSGPAVNEKRLECSLLLGYFKYCKIQMLMSRNEKMVNELRSGDQEKIKSKVVGGSNDEKKANTVIHEDVDAKYKRVEEIAHLYDGLLQDAKAIVSLPGIKLDEEEDVEDEFILQANANVLRIRALRCYYVGRMYAADKVAKYGEALALFDQAALLASEAAEEIAACQEMEEADELIKSMADLQNEINAVQVRTKASSFLASRGSDASSATSGLTLLCRLDDFDSGGVTYRVADVPPSLKPIPCKPAFFDIANNYINSFPTDALERHVLTTQGTTKNTRKGGFFTNLFGRT